MGKVDGHPSRQVVRRQALVVFYQHPSCFVSGEARVRGPHV